MATMTQQPKTLHGDPLLDEVHELLHRVLDCPSGETTHWMVRQALARLNSYEAQQQGRK